MSCREVVSDSSNRIKKDPDGHWTICGVYVGKKLNNHLYAEVVANRRFVIRSTMSDPTFAKRLGEVFGGDGDFQACTMRGTHVALARSLIEGAKALESFENSTTAPA